MVNLAESKFPEAIEEAHKEVKFDNFDPSAQLDLAFAYSEAGDKKEATRILDEVLEKTDVYYSPCSVGLTMLSLGKTAEGERWLEKALEQHDPHSYTSGVFPSIANMLPSPEGTEVDLRMGTPSRPSS